MEVVVVVDREQVAVDVGVTKQQLDPRDSVDGLQQSVELLEATIVGPLESEASVFSLKLQRKDPMLPHVIIQT